MTMFTEGRLQAYERMMRQTYMSCGRDHGSKNQSVNRNQNKNNGKQVVKGGVRHGSNKS